MYQKEEIMFQEFLSTEISPRYVDLNMIRDVSRTLSKKQRKNFQKLGKFKNPLPKNMLGEKDLDNNLSTQEWEWLKKEYSNKPVVVLVGTGQLDFSYQTYCKTLLFYIQNQLKGKPLSNEHLLEAEKKIFTYDDFLTIGRNSIGKMREDFSRLYYDCGSYVACYGKVQKKNNSKQTICFDHIYFYNPIELDATYSNYEGIEDHVWVTIKENETFEKINIGDNVSFSAIIYPYLKTGKGKQLDFGLLFDGNMEIIDNYSRPTEEEQRKHSIQHLICAELCPFNNHCYGHCIANEEWLQEQRMILGYYSKEPCNS